ncbi:hypothetical protein [Sinomonas sp. ASV322]|uniref:aggregation-promoting factor C-terminal-like domain-containing protein n=1 Tax=Sinomonas sp. ASV322 TaxID=3041920 RepID=UPI0027DBBE09|nr:hypothetical protein [Sinomonas sp. ASV322]MDQ4504220.1 hypothetical protein [Sinomonas sp. ASV322]
MSNTKSLGTPVRHRGRHRAETPPRGLARITAGLNTATGGRYRNAVVAASVGLAAAVSGGAAANGGDIAAAGSIAPAASTSPQISAASDAKLDFIRPSVGSVSKAQSDQQAQAAADAAKAELLKTQPVNDPAGAQAYASSQLAKFGWGQDQMQALITLWNRESNWTTTATNASSGAYGIAQSLPGGKMASAGSDWQTNYRTQIDWGLGYIKDRYGSPANALAFHYTHNWY